MSKERRDDIYELIAQNIKFYRSKQKISQAELAKRSGYSHITIRKIESKTNKKYFSIETIYNIADALETDVTNLFKNNN